MPACLCEELTMASQRLHSKAYLLVISQAFVYQLPHVNLI